MPASPEIQYSVVETGNCYEFLGPNQNFVDQAPFMDIPSLLPKGFFKDPTDPVGIAFFVRASRQPVNRTRSMYSTDYDKLKEYISGEIHSGVKLAVVSMHGLMADVPYLEQYLDTYWMKHSHLFTTSGMRKKERRDVCIPTFVAYQREYVEEHDRALLVGIGKLNLSNRRSQWYIQKMPRKL